MRQYYVYILTNYTKTTLYIGVTNNVEYRVAEHKTGEGSCFTGKYNLKFLVYYEEYDSILDAIYREKQLKKWNREWKEELINEMNPKWEDLSKEWYE
ncbi:GIY-YIG nuclease family protein [Candidatus Peregrinibacteria bacterium]|nr:GIY-YIG nuclease family protein [Candidatus Peregrinibacteria bacterium]